MPGGRNNGRVSRSDPGPVCKPEARELSRFGLVAAAIGATSSIVIGQCELIEDQQVYQVPPVPNGLFGAAAIDGNVAVVGARGSNTITMFRREGTSWLADTPMAISAPGGSAQLGFSVAVHGDVVIAGARDSAVAQVFRYDGKVWDHEQTLTPNTGITEGMYGFSVAVRGDIAIVGQPGDRSFTSASNADVFRCIDGTWEFQQTLTAEPNGPGGNGFGHAVAIGSDRIVVGEVNRGGTLGQHDGPGGAHVFQRISEGEWQLEAPLHPLVPTLAASTDFGQDVDICGDRIVVGAFEPNVGNGSVYVFRLVAGLWALEQHLQASDGQFRDAFGITVSIDGDVIVASAINNNERRGASYVFRHDGVEWVEEAKFIASDGAPNMAGEIGDQLGVGGVDAGWVIAGAVLDDDQGQNTGAAYFYRLDRIARECPPCPACPSDFNGDLLVDVADLLDFLAVWFPTSDGAPCD